MGRFSDVKNYLNIGTAAVLGVTVGGGIYYLLTNFPSKDVAVSLYMTNYMLALLSGSVVVMGVLLLMTAIDNKELEDRVKKLEEDYGKKH